MDCDFNSGSKSRVHISTFRLLLQYVLKLFPFHFIFVEQLSYCRGTNGVTTLFLNIVKFIEVSWDPVLAVFEDFFLFVLLIGVKYTST